MISIRHCQWMAIFLLVGCSTTQPESQKSKGAGQPFPVEAYLIAAEKLPKGKTFYWEDQPSSHTVPIPPSLTPQRPALFASNKAPAKTKIVTPKNPTGPAKIYVDLGEQKAYYFQGDWLRGVSRISSGKRGHSTPVGSYKVTQKNANHRSNLYGRVVDAEGSTLVGDADSRRHPVPEGGSFVGSSMPHFMRLQDAENKVHGVGFHAGRLPGYPASHGCIRLPSKVASTYFSNTPAGTPVEIIAKYPVTLEMQVALGQMTEEEAQAKRLAGG